ncbi:hypothetical protein NLG97_g2053 [Lecanicillium saksenae]|uniref:Uncharacterized protein n=1 Tax=Lecanicillium saksenae TaxID=468837 RepID=A0ACC1R5A4_9HYPO|nr:hypothetical protein NLG97_g2053 [Lecanicillium saksenae]
MAGSKFLVAPVIVILAAVLAGYINIASIYRSVRVLGILRAEESTIVKEQLQAIRIADTPYCEDLHRHAASGLLFTACEGSEETRHAWFPPLGIFDNVSKAVQTPGTIVVIDPETMKAKSLKLEGFSGPFVTHGIDVIDDPKAESGKAIYVFAVNHRPNADQDPLAPKADSVIEVFHHKIGTNTARHVRTVKHELIITPNDILALSPTSFLVTNDHFYRGGIMRHIEDIYTAATWSTTVYAEFEVGKTKPDDAAHVKANVALTGLHNNNGLGPGRKPGEVVLVDAAGGMVHFGEIKRKDDEVLIHVTDTFEAESTLDNPHYFLDPFANDTFDAGGFILAGLSKAINLGGNSRLADGKDGVMVWHLQDRPSGKGKWEAKLLLQDNADFIRTASGSVLIPTDPAKSNGRREAWLFVTGFMSKNVVAVKIGL